MLGRRPFEPLADLHSCLLKKNALRLARPFLELWVDELAQELDEWLTNLLTHVLEKRAARYARLR